ncbi:hypothetical protein HDU76_003287 [Blyttiomyces sp. JEL0837]|nr:hypothetical protein HDU76_003287 [Blyttiomyces sp. JEL0837]
MAIADEAYMKTHVLTSPQDADILNDPKVNLVVFMVKTDVERLVHGIRNTTMRFLAELQAPLKDAMIVYIKEEKDHIIEWMGRCNDEKWKRFYRDLLDAPISRVLKCAFCNAARFVALGEGPQPRQEGGYLKNVTVNENKRDWKRDGGHKTTCRDVDEILVGDVVMVRNMDPNIDVNGSICEVIGIDKQKLGNEELFIAFRSVLNSDNFFLVLKLPNLGNGVHSRDQMPPSIITTLLSTALAIACAPSLTHARTPFKPPQVRQLIDIKHGQPVTSNDTLISESTMGAKLQYYGGPLIANVQVFPIFYGSPLYKNELIAFYKAIYSTATIKIGKGSYIGSYSEASQLVYIDDASVLQPYLRNLVKIGIIKPTENTYIPVHFGPLMNIVQGTDLSCQAFCGFHGEYGVIPDQTGLCMGGCGPSLDPKDNLFAVTSHELGEAITNPGVSLATGYSYPLGWYDPANGENGDICNAMQTNLIGIDGVTYRVQLLWSNSQSACIGPTAPSVKVPTTNLVAVPQVTTKVPSVNTCHDVCVAGGPLLSTCGSCAALVLRKDSYCGTTAWDNSCVQEAKTYCGLNCEGAVPCDHDPCVMGTALKASCDTCVDKVLASDPYCGSTSWDAVCVSEAMTICGKKCLPRAAPGGAPQGPISIPGGSAGHTCTHDLCQLGAPLVASCDPCVALITSTDTFCGTTAWDLTCVMEALGCSTTNCRIVCRNKQVVQTSARTTSVKATSKQYIALTTKKATTTVKKPTSQYVQKTTTSLKRTTTTPKKTSTTIKKATTTAKVTSKAITSTVKPKYTTATLPKTGYGTKK